MENQNKLIELIRASEALGENEELRQELLESVPFLTEEEVVQVQGILENESTEEERLKKEYEADAAELDQQIIATNEELQHYVRRETLAFEEEGQNEDDNAEAEDILNQL